MITWLKKVYREHRRQQLYRDPVWRSEGVVVITQWDAQGNEVEVGRSPNNGERLDEHLNGNCAMWCAFCEDEAREHLEWERYRNRWWRTWFGWFMTVSFVSAVCTIGKQVAEDDPFKWHDADYPHRRLGDVIAALAFLVAAVGEFVSRYRKEKQSWHYKSARK